MESARRAVAPCSRGRIRGGAKQLTLSVALASGLLYVTLDLYFRFCWHPDIESLLRYVAENAAR